MKRAEAELLTQPGQVQRLLQIGVNVAAHPLHQILLRTADRHVARVAAPAGPVAGPFGGLRPGIETDLVAAREAGRTTGPTIDPGGTHRVHEQLPETAVALEHRLPEFSRS